MLRTSASIATTAPARTHDMDCSFVRSVAECHNPDRFSRCFGNRISLCRLREEPMPNQSQPSQRTVTAPEPLFTSAKALPNRVLSVVLETDEDVEWAWTYS